MAEQIIFKAHIDGNQIVPDKPILLPANKAVRVELTVLSTASQSKTQESKPKRMFGGRVAPEPVNVGSLSREEIYD